MKENITPKVSPREAALVNSYLDGNLSPSSEQLLENMAAENVQLAKMLREKTQKRERIKSLVPHKKLGKNAQNLLKSELRETTMDLLPEKKIRPLERLAKFLDTTILEF